VAKQMGTFNKTGLSLASAGPAEKPKTAPNRNKQVITILSFFITIFSFLPDFNFWILSSLEMDRLR
jgi:hypothetical protein